MTENLIERAELLIQQNRFAEAEQILSQLLSVEPDNPFVLARLGEVCLQLDKYERAMNLVDNAIAIAPDEDYFFFLKARILLQLDKYDAAEDNLKEATILDPSDAAYFALWASIKLARKKYQEAFDMSNHALALNPENVNALNVRSTSLLKLNRKEESFETIEGALKEDPNNPHTHTNYGWNLLEKGDPNKALEHFREALRIDPNYMLAQAGMAEALKAKHFVYRWFLKYAFWMGNMAAKFQWGFIIGFYFLVNFLERLAKNNELLATFLNPIVFILVLFAFSTWIIGPIANLFLRLNKYGRHLLDKEEIMSSNFVAVCVGVLLIGIIGYFLVGNNGWLALGGFGFTMMVPCSAMFQKTKNKNALPIYAAIMLVIGTLAVMGSFSSDKLFNAFTSIYLLGFIAFQWIVNMFAIDESNI